MVVPKEPFNRLTHNSVLKKIGFQVNTEPLPIIIFAQFNYNNYFIHTEENKPPGYWKDILNCRAFFHEFAMEQGFDPMEASNWYSVGLGDLRNRKGGQSIHEHHGGLKKALQKAFPDLSFTQWVQGMPLPRI